MSKTLSVKVKTTTLVEALRQALKERTERFANRKKLAAEYEKAHEKWKAEVIKQVNASIKSGKARFSDLVVGEPYRWSSSEHKDKFRVQLEYIVPKSLLAEEPKAPDLYNEWEFNRDKEALENAIRVLELSDSDVVSTSTYHSVVKYL